MKLGPMIVFALGCLPFTAFAQTNYTDVRFIENELIQREAKNKAVLQRRQALLKGLRGAKYRFSRGGNLLTLDFLQNSELGEIKVGSPRAAVQFVKALEPYLGTMEGESFEYSEVSSRPSGYVFYQRVYGLLVHTGRLSFRVNEQGQVTSVTNATVRQAVKPRVIPNISADAAKEIAYSVVKGIEPDFYQDEQRCEATLMLDQNEAGSRLFWNVMVYDLNLEVAPWQVYVDDENQVASLRGVR